MTEAMNGRIDVESELGIGTTFRVTIPLERCDVPLPVEPTRPSGPPVVGSLRVLVVEDDAILREIAQALLVRLGQHVTVAEDGVLGLAAARANLERERASLRESLGGSR